MKRLMVILAGLVVLPAHALLEDVAGANYSYDSSSHLYWLDPVATVGQSFNDVVASYGSAGWRHATSNELLALFSSNGVSVGSTTADRSAYNLADTMGGQTGISYSGWTPWIRGVYDSSAPVLGGRESPTAASAYWFNPEYTNQFVAGEPGHRYASLAFGSAWGPSGGAFIDPNGEALPDSVGTNLLLHMNHFGVGHFLVSTTASVIAPVPEPNTYAMMGLGLVGVFAASRRQRKQAAKV